MVTFYCFYKCDFWNLIVLKSMWVSLTFRHHNNSFSHDNSWIELFQTAFIGMGHGTYISIPTFIVNDFNSFQGFQYSAVYIQAVTLAIFQQSFKKVKKRSFVNIKWRCIKKHSSHKSRFLFPSNFRLIKAANLCDREVEREQNLHREFFARFTVMARLV